MSVDEMISNPGNWIWRLLVLLVALLAFAAIDMRIGAPETGGHVGFSVPLPSWLPLSD